MNRIVEDVEKMGSEIASDALRLRMAIREELSRISLPQQENKAADIAQSFVMRRFEREHLDAVEIANYFNAVYKSTLKTLMGEPDAQA